MKNPVGDYAVKRCVSDFVGGWKLMVWMVFGLRGDLLWIKTKYHFRSLDLRLTRLSSFFSAI